MVRFRTVIALSTGVAIGYVMGSAAGRPAFDRIKSMAGSAASEFGLADAGQRLRERGDDLARASADLASTATQGAVDTAADTVEKHLVNAQSKIQQSGSAADGSSHD
jgi:hypothetical protein